MHVIVGVGIIFGLLVLMVLMGLWVWDRADESAYNRVDKNFNEFKAGVLPEFEKVKKTSIDAGAMAWTNEQRVNSLVKRVEDLEKEAGHAQDHYAKLREGQFDLQNKLSNKRPVVRLPAGAIQVEIYSKPFKPSTDKPTPKNNKRQPLGRGVRSLLRDQ